MFFLEHSFLPNLSPPDFITLWKNEIQGNGLYVKKGGKKVFASIKGEVCVCNICVYCTLTNKNLADSKCWKI